MIYRSLPSMGMPAYQPPGAQPQIGHMGNDVLYPPGMGPGQFRPWSPNMGPMASNGVPQPHSAMAPTTAPAIGMPTLQPHTPNSPAAFPGYGNDTPNRGPMVPPPPMQTPHNMVIDGGGFQLGSHTFAPKAPPTYSAGGPTNLPAGVMASGGVPVMAGAGGGSIGGRSAPAVASPMAAPAYGPAAGGGAYNPAAVRAARDAATQASSSGGFNWSPQPLTPLPTFNPFAGMGGGGGGPAPSDRVQQNINSMHAPIDTGFWGRSNVIDPNAMGPATARDQSMYGYNPIAVAQQNMQAQIGNPSIANWDEPGFWHNPGGGNTPTQTFSQNAALGGGVGGGGYGGYGVPGGPASLLQQYIAMQQAANNANINRYNDEQSGYGALQDWANQQLGNFSNQNVQDTKNEFENQKARTLQFMVGSGMANGSPLYNQWKADTSAETAALNRTNDLNLQRNLNTTIPLAQARFGLMEKMNQNGPDANQLAGLMAAAGNAPSGGMQQMVDLSGIGGGYNTGGMGMGGFNPQSYRAMYGLGPTSRGGDGTDGGAGAPTPFEMSVMPTFGPGMGGPPGPDGWPSGGGGAFGGGAPLKPVDPGLPINRIPFPYMPPGSPIPRFDWRNWKPRQGFPMFPNTPLVGGEGPGQAIFDPFGMNGWATGG